MNIAVIGSGYVGLVVGTCLAETGNQVICVDQDKRKVRELKKNIMPICEPELDELVKRNQEEERLYFTTDIKKAVLNSKLIYLAVGTPLGDGGDVDLSAIYNAATDIGESMGNEYKIIINKSTVPVGTAKKVKEIIKSRTDADFDVVSNPEFLKEGNAVEDFMKPDRIIVGTDNTEVAELMSDLYAPYLRTGNPIIIMSVESAEMTKYACNAMLATRISFMNEMANLCERIGADIEEIRIAMGADPRIGSKFIFPGVGFGGSCLPKDIKAICQMGRENNYRVHICEAVDNVNEEQRRIIYKKIKSHFGDIKGKTIAIWGLAFKPRTDDMREASSIITINLLLGDGASVNAYDPVSMKNAGEIFGNKVKFSKNPYDCLVDADALAVMTEWNEFRNPDFKKIGELMKNKVVFDGRNIFNIKRLKELNFDYYGIGRA